MAVQELCLRQGERGGGGDVVDGEEGVGERGGGGADARKGGGGEGGGGEEGVTEVFARIYFYYNTAAGRVRSVENRDDSEVGAVSPCSRLRIEEDSGQARK